MVALLPPLSKDELVELLERLAGSMSHEMFIRACNGLKLIVTEQPTTIQVEQVERDTKQQPSAFLAWFVEQFGPEPHLGHCEEDLERCAANAELHARLMRDQFNQKVAWNKVYNTALLGWNARKDGAS